MGIQEGKEAVILHCSIVFFPCALCLLPFASIFSLARPRTHEPSLFFTLLGKNEWAQNEIDTKNPNHGSGKPLKPYTCLLKWAVFENALYHGG